MSTAVLSNLRDYLCGTLTPDNMLWLSKQLSDYAQQQKEQPPLQPPYTKEEINKMLDEAEARIAAGIYVTNEEVMRWVDEELAEEEELELAEAV